MGQVRVSVANLATRLRCTEDGIPMYFGIPNPKQMAQGVKIFQALGGGAELSGTSVLYLQDAFNAEKFEEDERTGFYDARFQVSEEHLEDIFNFFAFIANKRNSYELDPIRDILGELSGKEFPEMGTILTPEEVATVELTYVKTVRQKVSENGVGTSTRGAAAGVPSRRMFRIYEMVVTPQVYQKMAKSPIVRFFSHEELVTTDGGSRKGKTTDGLDIADNLFLVD